MVLERLDHALDRGRASMPRCWATRPTPTPTTWPSPIRRAPARALHALGPGERRGGPAEIDYINAHGPGTEVGDPAETKAIKTLFGEHAYRVPISSTKSMVGHALGGAGAIEAMACVKTIETGIIHPTINYEVPDPDCDLDYVPNVARKAGVRTTCPTPLGWAGRMPAWC
jgi:3-oxoacyl-[acyl-carrier-protein] synthase II